MRLEPLSFPIERLKMQYLRPYAKIWHKQFPTLRLVEQDFLDKSQGFDDCRWCLFKK